MLDRLLRWFGLDKKQAGKIILGSFIMAFSLVNIHSQSGITEGGILGLSMFCYKVLNWDAAIIQFLLDAGCIILAISYFGKPFLKKTAFTILVFSNVYKIILLIGPVLPNFYHAPLLAAILGGIGIGFGAGLVISQGGATGGDDAIAFLFSKKTKVSLATSYLVMDVVVLLLSLVYIPFARIFFSLITTTVSSVIVGQFEVELPKQKVPTGRITA